MRMLAVISLIAIQSWGADEKSVPCKILRTDNMVLVGQCIEIENETFFYSCIDFTCQVNRTLLRKLEPEDGTCGEPILKKDFLEKLKRDHPNSKHKDIPFCYHSK